MVHVSSIPTTDLKKKTARGSCLNLKFICAQSCKPLVTGVSVKISDITEFSLRVSKNNEIIKEIQINKFDLLYFLVISFSFLGLLNCLFRY